MAQRTIIQKAREWIILLIGLVLMAFAGYLFFVDRNDLWAKKIGDMWIYGAFFLGIVMVAQPKRLGKIIEKVTNIFIKIK